MIGDITGFVVTDFINQSNTLPAARRQLEDLRAALNHYRDEGYIRYAPAIKLPKKAEPKVRWLSRDEAARLIRAAMHMKQSWKGQTSERYTGRHLARFILIGIYTGTRSAAIFNAAIRPTTGRGYVDLNRGVFYRKAHDAVDTRKRQTPVRIADRLLVHMRRWATTEFTLGQHTVRRGKSKNIGRMISQDYIVEWEGKPVQSIKNAFRKACKIAGLGWHVWDEKKGRNVFKTDVTPHILRHTAATWLMQNGASPSDAADYLGMTEPVLRKHYYHQHPDFQAGVAERTTAKPQALTVKSRIVRRRYDGQGPPDGEAAWWTSRDR
ncbi:integrase [Mesorhizobium albiziae]|nr:integrase [Mesorhizobium albiziae]